MNSNIVIRPETGADSDGISEVTIAAFKTLKVSNQTEQFIVAELRKTKALSVSLVAELNSSIVGHIAFSPVTLSGGAQQWYGLGPLSVLPNYQRQGIGTALIREGISRLMELNAEGCCVVGHPDYYRKFGFANPHGLVLEGVPPSVFLVRSFSGKTPNGTVTFHEGFKATDKSDN